MRICHVGRDIQRTGGGEVLKQLATRMAADGHEVTVVTDTPRALTGLPHDVDVRTTPLGPRLLAWHPRTRAGWHARHAAQIAVFSLASTAEAIRLRRDGHRVVNHNCEALTGDVVVMHNTFTAEFRRRGLRGAGRAKALMNPVRAMRLGKERLLAASRASRVFVAVAPAARDDVAALVRGRHPVEVVQNGIDLDRFTVADAAARRAARVRFGIADGERVIVFIGHEYLRKGLLELIDALALLPADLVLFVAGGESQDGARFRAAAAGAGVGDRVRFLGTVGDVPALLAAADVFCLPSRYETVPMVALEALACGVPTVLSRHCPAAEFLTGASGAVCDVEPASIARSVARAAELRRGPSIRSTVAALGWSDATTAYLRVLAGTAREDPRVGATRTA